MKPKILLSVLSILFLQFSSAQTNPTSATKVQEALQQKAKITQNSTVKNIEFTNIGPTVMSGRVVDLDVNPNNTTEFYVAYASGGLWYTKNNGTTFEPVLDSSPTQNIGDIAVDWTSKTIWVGTGENNSSRSSYAGIGILKSTDNGKNWENTGLLDSHHISRIVINPNNGNEVVVAVLGHLYTPNAERGIFKTTDGGKTWNKTLFVNNDTGIVDLAVAPNNFNVQYASSWERDRKAWNFVGNGINSAIYKSTDAGQTWNKINEKSGFPVGDGVGRIGLAVYDAETVYAFHDSQFRREEDKKKKKSDSKALTKDDFKTMSSSTFLSLTDKKLNTYLKMNGFQEKYRAENVKQLVRSGTIKPVDLSKYLENANSLLFDTPVVGAQIFKTTNGGKSWNKTHDDYLDDLVYSYGYYFGMIRVSPKNPDQIYIAGVPILRSQDGGKTYKSINGQNVHVDHHSLWVNPNNPNHLINGNDGGVNISYDNGDNWIKCNTPAVGQFYAIYADEQTPYKVYGGLQDNGVWVGSNSYKASVKWHEEGQYPYERIMGGDGMQVQVDNRNPNIVYTGYQFGNYFRIDRESGNQKYIQPKHELGESPYRFNWQTPIHLSVHNQDILYLGGNKLHRSLNKGDDWTTISGDLTQGGRKGNVAYGTLTSISESPFQFGLLYVGSDDGLIHVTKNGADWLNISNGLPKDLWVTRVIASAHKKERVYITLNGYRWDDFTTYVYMSDNYGQTWKNIGSGIPASPVNVIREDPENEHVLYVGTDNGAYASLDMGKTWQPFHNGLPNVAVHDIVVQKQAKDLLLGTHGRSIYKANIAVLQETDATIKNKDIHIFTAENVRYRSSWGSTWSKWLAPNVPAEHINFHAKKAGEFTVKVIADKDVVMNEYQVNADAGFNTWTYDLSVTPKGRKKYIGMVDDITIAKKKNGVYYLPKGTYTIEVSGNGGKDSTKLVIE